MFIMGRRYLLTVLPARPVWTPVGAGGAWSYTVTLPPAVAGRLVSMSREEPGAPLILTILATPSPWYHIIRWWSPGSDELYRQLPPRARREVSALGLRSRGPVVLVPARPEALRRLGLDPRGPVTLRDVVRAAGRGRLAPPRCEDQRRHY